MTIAPRYRSSARQGSSARDLRTVGEVGRAAHLVPRRDLISNLRILMERGLLKIPPTIHAKEALIKELIHLKDNQGTHHDDLAISLTLAAWQSTQGIRDLINREQFT